MNHKPGIVEHDLNPGTQEAEAGQSVTWRPLRDSVSIHTHTRTHTKRERQKQRDKDRGRE